LGERVAHCYVWRLSACAEVAEPIDFPFGLWARVGRMMHKFNIVFARWRQCAHMGGHIRNTNEPSVCDGNAVLCQITLTTCYQLLMMCVFYYAQTFKAKFHYAS